MLELHGNLVEVRCTRCGRTRDRPGDRAPRPARAAMPAAPWSGPAVVWFGEALPPDVWEAADGASAHADVLLVVGTSAVVYPAAGLVSALPTRPR